MSGPPDESLNSVDIDSFSGQPPLGNEQMFSGDDDMSYSEISGAAEGSTPRAPPTRSERLSGDLLKLRRINAALGSYLESLKNVRAAHDLVAQRVSDSNRLLDSYVDVLWQTEQTTKLVFDPEWQGSQEDDAILERERVEQEEKRRREQEEQERREREAAARHERERAEEEAKRLAAEKAAKRGGRGGRVRPPAVVSSTRGSAASRTTTRGRGTSGIARGIRPG
ncbi:hypothetical protein BKA62DRAFT_14442 [Auriculariales sp. MPI-PUGE-AT-0066]|nr:hypothetical protein BKA62DRAFT_14442 [Auriculariales sp. MPI-PUGE-AT-0066]